MPRNQSAGGKLTDQITVRGNYKHTVETGEWMIDDDDLG